MAPTITTARAASSSMTPERSTTRPAPPVDVEGGGSVEHPGERARAQFVDAEAELFDVAHEVVPVALNGGGQFVGRASE
jgi:hypothetical protein